MVLIGAGNMATNLGHAFAKAGMLPEMVWSKTETSARQLGEALGCPWTTDLAGLPKSDLYVYSVKDLYLPDVLKVIDAPDALHLHTAGSMGLAVFEEANKSHVGVFYPFQSVSKGRVLDFAHIPIFLETLLPEDMPKVKQLAERISDEVYEADSAKRKQLHLAGVFANNFTNAMYRIAGELLAETGIPEKVLLSLADETAAKIHEVPAKNAQTGPAVRGDKNVMQAHLDMLPTDNLKEIYKAISEYIGK